MLDDPLYPREIHRVELGVITDFSPINLADVPRGMLLKLGANTDVDPRDMMVEQRPIDKGIVVYYLSPESDEEYQTRLDGIYEALQTAEAQAAAAREIEVSWQKFKQLADRFSDRILVLTVKPEYE